MASGSKSSSSSLMSVRGMLAPLSNAEMGVALSTSSAAQASSLRPGDAPTLAQLAALEAQKNKRRQSEKKKAMAHVPLRGAAQEMRQRDAERKRVVREQMTPEQKHLERVKDAKRKADKRRREKEERR
eukprot:IDg22427t1